MPRKHFDNIPGEMPIIGLTGALGSGCSYLSHGLAEFHNYFHCSLSKIIHEVCREKGLPETIENLQVVGDDLRRLNGRDVLVLKALEEADAKIPPPPPQIEQGKLFANQLADNSRPVGLVIDGIRNIGEVDALRQYPNFYLISVQADSRIREQRLMAKGRFKTSQEFLDADKRDAEEHNPNGQQVKLCNYLADIIILNDSDIAPDAALNRQRFISEAVYNKHIMLIEHLAARGGQPVENRASLQEALMTVAYVESKRSSCLKRKVGAVIATAKGELLAAGHNDVPETTKPCLEDAQYRWCARDVIQEQVARKIRRCPNCGKEVNFEYACPKCNAVMKEFVKRCPNCKEEVDYEYECPQCKEKVYEEFLPGANGERTGKLLDMCRSLHAEENAILNLSKTGVKPPPDAVLYSTTFPCNLCANKIVAMSIKTVVYAEPYTMPDAQRVLAANGVRLIRFQGVKSRAYFRLYS